MLRFLLAAFLALATAGAWAQSCDVTVSTCAAAQAAASSNLGTAKTICLNSGNYGTCDFFDMSRTADAVIKSTTGVGASGSWRVGNSDHLQLESLTGSFLINNCSRWITLKNTVGTPNSFEGIAISQEACPTTVQNITIDGAILDRIGQQGSDGRLAIRDGNTITVTNSQFLGVYANAPYGPSDGIQMYGAIRNITIGPGNIFKDIWQPTCNAYGGAHCDTIQTYGGPCTNVKIEGNFFQDSSTTMLNESDCDGTFKNNVLRGLGDAQFHTWNPLIWEHNTLYNSTFRINGSASFPSNATVRNNIFHNSGYDTTGTYPCTACTASYNVFTSGCTGTNCITGTPTYVGGAAPPSTWSGWELAPGSVGENNGSDGMDRGTLYYGVAQAPDTEAPTTPTSPSATPTGSTTMNVTWTASTDNVAVTGYNVRRCSGAACTPSTIVGTPATNSFGDTGLTASTLYRYTIQAFDAASNTSSQSSVAQGTTNAPASYTVAPSEVLGASYGSISPATPQSVTEGNTTAFTVTPNGGYQALMGGTCGGSLVGTTYTTSTITGNCSVTVNFVPSSCELMPAANVSDSTSMTTQTGTFTYVWSIIPAVTNHDIVIGQNNGTWTNYDSFATGVLFGTGGTVTVRNGASYAADATFSYSANQLYNVRMVVDIPSHVYDVFIAQDGGAETQVANDYAFRASQSAVTQLTAGTYIGATGAPTGAYVCPTGISSLLSAPTNLRWVPR